MAGYSDAIELPKGSLMKVYLNSGHCFPLKGPSDVLLSLKKTRRNFLHRIRRDSSNGALPRLAQRHCSY